MNKFNFDDYDDEDESPNASIIKNVGAKNNYSSDFSFDDYDEEVPINTKTQTHNPYWPEEKSVEEVKKLSARERYEYAQELKTAREYAQSKGFTKGLLKGASVGFSELIPGLEEQEGELLSGLGEFVGAVAPISAAAKAVSYPAKILQGLTKFGKAGKAVGLAPSAFRIAQSTATGALYGTAKELANLSKGEDFSGLDVAKEAATFGLIHSVLEGIPAGYNWIKSLNPTQEAEVFIEGVIPDNMTPNQYKFYVDEVYPDAQVKAKKNSAQAYENAVKENDLEFQRTMANTQAQHENDLIEISKKKEVSQKDFMEAQVRHENKQKQVAAEHEAKVQEIEQQNQLAMKDFEEQEKQFEILKKRESIVKDAIQPQTSEVDLTGRVRPEGQDIGYRPAPPYTVQPTLKNRVGSVISPNEITNSTDAGKTQIATVRANDAIDYGEVRNAYTLSDQLNETVVSTQDNLVQELRSELSRLKAIPDPSPPQKQLMGTIEKVLQETQIVNEAGDLIGLKPINNRVLQEQAKSLRYYMDFNFEHGNSRGIFSPIVRQLENGVEYGARSVGNEEAVEASKNARRLYSEWADAYDNPYIRPYRDTSNQSFSKTFQDSLDIDNFNVVNNILNRSNSGQQIGNSTRRALVDKKLGKFFDNPRSYNRTEFDTAMRELDAVISPSESRSIRRTFDDARRTPVIKGKKVETSSKPEKAALKQQPRGKVVPFTKKPAEVPEITQVKIPQKPSVKPTREMHEAGKQMGREPSDLMKLSDTPEGLKELKKGTSPQIYERIEDHKVKDIFFEGNVQRKFNGGEIYKIMNKGNNYALLSEIWGEDVTADLLEVAKGIEEKRATVDMFKKLGSKAATIKLASTVGLI